jgi:hypothetical protein
MSIRESPPKESTVGVSVLAALAYVWFLAGTKPFTTAANVMTAIPLVVAGIVAVVRSRTSTVARPTRVCRYGQWWVAIGVLAAWELFQYAQSPRAQHPTFSSIYDSVATWHPAKAAIAAVWLLLGALIVRGFGRDA